MYAYGSIFSDITGNLFNYLRVQGYTHYVHTLYYLMNILGGPVCCGLNSPYFTSHSYKGGPFTKIYKYVAKYYRDISRSNIYTEKHTIIVIKTRKLSLSHFVFNQMYSL